MERMTFGDAAQLTRMLRQFARDQREDKALLEGHLGNLDIDGVLLLVHRIAGRTGQVGGRRLAADFRRMEKMLTRSRALDAATIARLQDMGGQLDELIRLAEERAAGLGTPKTPIGA
jgi:HPt (histidine-containing phosphotransfer) domain-containing protein